MNGDAPSAAASFGAGALKFRAFGDQGLLLQVCAPGEHGSALRQLALRLRQRGLAGLLDCVAASDTLLVHIDPLTTSIDRIKEHVIAELPLEDLDSSDPSVIRIEVHYGGVDGPDLGVVAQRSGLTEHEVVVLHTHHPMPVEMIGFMPGFPYIGGLPPALDLPRRAAPRVAVPAGSVAVAAGRTGIYPVSAPGGWHVIGKTEAVLFDPQRDPPSLLLPGDYVQFVSQG